MTCARARSRIPFHSLTFNNLFFLSRVPFKFSRQRFARISQQDPQTVRNLSSVTSVTVVHCYYIVRQCAWRFPREAACRSTDEEVAAAVAAEAEVEE